MLTASLFLFSSVGFPDAGTGRGEEADQSGGRQAVEILAPAFDYILSPDAVLKTVVRL